ncbi:DIAP2-like protein [Mya arenaria]|uniref:DIAP2-like protein n=1 Tax=Mya arenaria TaxID=6604 RepID=A0ABY7EH44_MYAAR|nr:baculoviral IAP repeat-containing protein 7-A-like [Mya arenaria]WAR07714.1 DIAP2-like protein [Mya arenaria]
MYFLIKVFLFIITCTISLCLYWGDKQNCRELSNGRDFVERWENATTTCVGHMDMMESVKMNRSQFTTGIEISKNTLNGNNDTHDLWLFVKGTIPELPIEKHLDSAILMLCFCYVKIKHGPTSPHIDHEMNNVLDLFSSKIGDCVREAAKNTKQHMTRDLYTNFFEPAARHIQCFPLSRDNQHMEQEWNRFASFNKFPVDNPDISFIRLSQSGFFYTGDKDIVQCFSCGVTNNEWPREVSVDDTHRNISPDCAFITGKDESNIAIHSANESSGNQGNSACSVGPNEEVTPCHNHGKPEYINRNELENDNGDHQENGRKMVRREISDSTNTAKYPEYANTRKRHDTFKEWAYSHIVSSKHLVECGLFHTGVADCVRCFFCGGGMRNWEHGDDPWIEHARWFPHCQYVKQCKGQEFIDTCLQTSGLESFGNSDTDTDQRYIDQQTLFEDTESASASSIVPSESNDNRTLIKELQEMGFSANSIDEALLQPTHNTDSYIARKEEVIDYLLTYQSAAANHETEHVEEHNLNITGWEQSSNITDREHSSNINDREQISNITDRKQSSNITDKEQISNITDSTKSIQSPEAASKNTFPAEQRRATGLDEAKQKLSEENESLKQQMMCKVCMDNDASMVFLPCGHMVTCTECAHALRKCAICRTVIKGTVRAFMS